MRTIGSKDTKQRKKRILTPEHRANIAKGNIEQWIRIKSDQEFIKSGYKVKMWED